MIVARKYNIGGAFLCIARAQIKSKYTAGEVPPKQKENRMGMNAAGRRWRQKNKSHGPRGRAGARVGRGRRAGGLAQEPVVQREGPVAGRALHAVAIGDGAASARTAAEKREPWQRRMEMKEDVTRNVVSAQTK